MKCLVPEGIAAPFGRYSHGVEVPANCRFVRSSGQLGLSADGSIPDDVEAQADICFGNIDRILAAADMGSADIIHISAFVTDRAFMPAYMKARDRYLADIETPPASTLMIVSGFTRAEFKVEVEVTAASAMERLPG